MEARIALASVVVFGGVLAAGMLVSRADGGEASPGQPADFGQEAVVAQAPQDLAGSQLFASSPSIRWDDDDWDDDDRDHDDDDDHDRDHDDDDRYERDEWDDDD